MTAPSEPAQAPPVAAVLPEPVQRWRLVAARAADAPRLTQRETTTAWEAAIRTSGLPMVPIALPSPTADADGAPPEPIRPRLSFGASLAVGMPADAELLDVLLAERWPRWRVREALEATIPDGWRLIDLEDVWLAGPALAGLVAAADYRIELDTDASAAAIGEACGALLTAESLPREREKGGATVTYDLRPLLIAAEVVAPGPPVVLTMRTRIHPSLGTGRSEEVVAAIAAVLGRPVATSSTVRVRLLLADEVD